MPAMNAGRLCRCPIVPRPTRAGAAVVLLAVASAAALVMGGAGPLDPPAGPVTPTYRTLTQVEPRTPIAQPAQPASAEAMVVITQPGSYYLTGNITAPDRSGIRILASDVTLDLNGFAITGANATGTSGVRGSTGFLANVAVVNGSIASFATAIAISSDNATFEGLRIRNCGQGITNNTMSFAGVCRGNTFSFLSDTAISMGEAALIADNQIRYTFGVSATGPAIVAADGARIIGNSVSSAPAVGIEGANATHIDSNTVLRSGHEGILVGSHSHVLGNTIRNAGRLDNTRAGIRAASTAGATIEGNTVAASPVGVRTGGGAVVVRNRLLGNSTPLQTLANDVVGPTVAPATIATGTNALANIVN